MKKFNRWANNFSNVDELIFTVLLMTILVICYVGGSCILFGSLFTYLWNLVFVNNPLLWWHGALVVFVGMAIYELKGV